MAEPDRLRQVIEAQIGNLILSLAEASVKIEGLTAQLAAVTKERDDLKPKDE